MAIKIISEADAEALRPLPFGRKHPVRAFIEALKPGEQLHIGREDFRWKEKTPNYFCRQISKTGRKRFNVFNETGRTGWLVKRVK